MPQRLSRARLALCNALFRALAEAMRRREFVTLLWRRGSRLSACRASGSHPINCDASPFSGTPLSTWNVWIREFAERLRERVGSRTARPRSSISGRKGAEQVAEAAAEFVQRKPDGDRHLWRRRPRTKAGHNFHPHCFRHRDRSAWRRPCGRTFRAPAATSRACLSTDRY